MGLIKLAIDRQNRKLVSFGESVTELPQLYQTNTQQFRIQIVDPETSNPFRAVYNAVDCSAMDLRLVIVGSVTGGDDTVIAALFEADWSYDTDNDWFTGSLELNTDEMAAFLDQVAYANAVLEINLMEGGLPTTILGSIQGSTNIVISANGDDLSASGPTPIDSYYTQSQTEALWLTGTGTPEGVKTAGPGRTYLDTASGNFWMKLTGTGNTGWIMIVGT